MRLATCHPERKYQARGLCKPCYDRYLKSTNPGYKHRQLENTERWLSDPVNAAAWRQKNAERWQRRKADPAHTARRRDARLRKQYGMSQEGYVALLASQGGGCAVCYRQPGKRPLHVDHDHDTGRVRGLLCHQCNWYLGTIDADPGIVLRIAAYRAQA